MARGQRANRTFDGHVRFEGKIRDFKEIKFQLSFSSTFLSSEGA